MFFSLSVATVWIVFSVSNAHDPDAASALLGALHSELHSEESGVALGGSSGVHNCWRPGWCDKDTVWCASRGRYEQRCGAMCNFPHCPTLPTCGPERKRCDDGSYVTRDPHNGCSFDPCPVTCPHPQSKQCPGGEIVLKDPKNHCLFPQCPALPTCPPLTMLCPDGFTRVGRDPTNLCITWLPCPDHPKEPMWTCANGWQEIPMHQVCNGIRMCADGSDEHPDHGCQQWGPGRRLENSEKTEDSVSDEDSTEFRRSVRIPYLATSGRVYDDEAPPTASLVERFVNVPRIYQDEGDYDDEVPPTGSLVVNVVNDLSDSDESPLQQRLQGSFGRRCCYGMTASCLACQAGVDVQQFCRWEENRHVVGCERFQPRCCKAFTAECLSCSLGMSEHEFCENPLHAHIPGCDRNRCCMAHHSVCKSCKAGQTEEEFCRGNPSVPGCEKFRSCCRALNSFCLSACAGMTEEEYCDAFHVQHIPSTHIQGCENFVVFPGRRIDLEEPQLTKEE